MRSRGVAPAVVAVLGRHAERTTVIIGRIACTTPFLSGRHPASIPCRAMSASTSNDQPVKNGAGAESSAHPDSSSLPTQSSPLPVTTHSTTSSSFLHQLGTRLQGLRGDAASRAVTPSSTSPGQSDPSSSPLKPSGLDLSKLQLPSLDPPRPLTVLLAVGSFSPITAMHVLLFETARNHLMWSTQSLDVVGGLISPVHDAYGKPSLVAAQHRIEMTRCATAASSWIATSAWEVEQPGWSTTAATLSAYSSIINAAYPAQRSHAAFALPSSPAVRVVLLCGADLVESFLVPGLWAAEDLDVILSAHGVAVIERVGLDLPALIDSHDVLRRHRANIHIVPQRVVNNVSSTEVRRMVREGLSIDYLVHRSVRDYIHRHALYGHDPARAQQRKQHPAFPQPQPP